MVPSAVVFLEKMPLSSTGKVDRRRLPACDARPSGQVRACSATTPVEACLAGIFASLLGRDQVDMHDDFFRLGGHSLLAMQAASRTRQALGANLPPVILFENSTVAASLDPSRNTLAKVANRRLHSCVPRSGPAFTGVSALDLGRPPQVSRQDDGQYEPGVSPARPPRRWRLHNALAILVERHEALRTNFVEVDGHPTQIVSAAGPLELPFVDLSKLPEAIRLAEAQRYFDQEVRHRYDLATDRLLRPALLRLDDLDHVFTIAFNHIIFDGWSLNIFNREFQAPYQALVTGKRIVLPELPFQPVDIACWERRYFQTAAAHRQVAYWKSHLHKAVTMPRLPGDGSVRSRESARATCTC